MNLKDLNRTLAVVVSGGGLHYFSQELNKGGMSSILHSIQVPYSMKAYDDILNVNHLNKFVSAETAYMLAVSMMMSLELTTYKALTVLVCSASLHVEGQREGRKNVAFLSKIDLNSNDEGLFSFDVFISKELEMLGECRDSQELYLGNQIEKFLFNNEGAAQIFRDQSFQDLSTSISHLDLECGVAENEFVLCGSFNPFHEGHLSMAKLGSDRAYSNDNVWNDLVIEVSASNQDKGIISPKELKQRIYQITDELRDSRFKANAGRATIRASIQPRFIDKLKAYNNPTFLVGSDTIKRIFRVEDYEPHDKFIEKIKYEDMFGEENLPENKKQ